MQIKLSNLVNPQLTLSQLFLWGWWISRNLVSRLHGRIKKILTTQWDRLRRVRNGLIDQFLYLALIERDFSETPNRQQQRRDVISPDCYPQLIEISCRN